MIRSDTNGVLSVGLLGELSLSVDGESLVLPASKKSRALLAYLVASGRTHLRERMCELLWDMPGDARAALRWSLTKVRPLLDGGGVKRLVADRDRVTFERHAVDVDADRLRREVPGDPAALPIETLRRAVLLFRGEFLEGLELPSCYKYNAWCISERDSARRIRTAILAALADRLADDPKQAVHFARARVGVDPLVEQAHVQLIRLLVRAGRVHDARQQYEVCRRILENELHPSPSAELEIARAELSARTDPPPVRSVAPPPQARLDPKNAALRASPLVGRQRERGLIERELVAASKD